MPISTRRHFVSALLLSFVCCIPLISGCAKKSPESDSGAVATSNGNATKRIVFLSNVPAPYWDACAAGCKSAEADLKLNDEGYEVIFEQNTKGLEGQIRRLEQWGTATDIAAVGISLLEPENPALVDAMLALKEKGIPVITIDSDINRENPAYRKARFGYIGTDNFAAGKELGKATKALQREGGQFTTFVGYTTQANAIERHDGFIAGVGEDFTEAEFLADDVDEAKARQNVHDTLNRHPEVNVFVGLWAYNPPAVADAVDELGIRDKTKNVGFDADPRAIQNMSAGKIDVLVVQNPYQMGYRGVRLLQALVEDNQEVIDELFPNYSEPDGDIHETGLKIIVPNDSSPISKELFLDTTEYLTLEQFQAWLDEYKLTGS
ncbi:substrate-binding domain-containing protein [Calycomorphotria hydatis]|uniref:D-ribose-binding periplasmic protein n=1 Tax=Calycomorphotria hydatis TaxID=2528027 RepID=A0A517T845_9PLAN|nr:substrate-binding domain-containing protein [Calycomorphotria hydatis]QDT64540.1 D-ribose-binding periplasmic protein precursor [Calycomorphotria hydatis]